MTRFLWANVTARPQYQVGDAIAEYRSEHSTNLRFYITELLRVYRRHSKRPQRHRVRKLLAFITQADHLQATIIAVEPFYAQPTYGISNQCYINGVSGAASGLTWHYKLLFTGHYEGNNVCVIPDVWISERDLHAQSSPHGFRFAAA